MTNLSDLNIDTMSLAEFEQYLPDFFATYNGRISDNPRFATFLEGNPDCAALVRDLEYIAETAKSLFEPTEDPSDAVWSNIQSKLSSVTPEADDLPNSTATSSHRP
jgi:hypothetical protein